MDVGKTIAIKNGRKDKILIGSTNDNPETHTHTSKTTTGNDTVNSIKQFAISLR